MRRQLMFAIGVIAAVAAVRLVKARPGAIALAPPADVTQHWDPSDVTAAYAAECPVKIETPRCAALRGALHYEIVSALELVTTLPVDPGDAVLASDALGIDDPWVREAALRVLGRASTAAAHPKLLAILLDDPHWTLQKSAAQILASSPDPNLVRVGSLWQRNHPDQIGVIADSTAPSELLWKSAPRPTASAAGFAPYPGTTRYTPAESDRALGFMTRDPVDKVVAFYTKGTKPLDATQWSNWVSAHQAAYLPKFDQAAIAALQRRVEARVKKGIDLQARYMKNQDPKLLEQINAIAAENEADSNKVMAAQEQPEDRPGVMVVGLIPPGVEATARLFLEEDQNRARRVTVVYREDAVGATIVMHAWDPKLVKL